MDNANGNQKHNDRKNSHIQNRLPAVVKDGKVIDELALPIAGLMCDLEADVSQKKLGDIKNAAGKLGVSEKMDPLLNMSFASLAVIPNLRLTTLGVVDVEKFKLI